MISSLMGLFNRFVGFAVAPFFLLYLRYNIAKVFWDSGNIKLDDWETTLYLFRDEFKLPFIPPEIAAYLATAFELACPVFIMLGLMTRFASVPLLAMAFVIQFLVTENPAHIQWMIILGTLICFGPGKISLDYAICSWMQKKHA